MSEACAQLRLPDMPCFQAICDAPGWIRTSDPRIRSPMLYPAELRGPDHIETGAPATELRRIGFIVAGT
jgi:hypothetical protein